MKTIGIFGGTFDPIHNGHLSIARQIYQQCQLQEIRFVPCQKPVLKKTAVATPTQRLEMLKLALADQKNFVIDERELNRTTPSYTFDTLHSLHTEFLDVSLCLLLGSDNLNTFTQWHRWQELITLANFIIVMRSDYSLPQFGTVYELLKKYVTSDISDLHKKSAGNIFISDVVPPPISATKIREKIAKGVSSISEIPTAVWEYIQKTKLYL